MDGNRDRESGFPRLDPGLLASPFEVQTNWHVITGAPCCGKTTMINLVAEKGYQVLPEAGRMYIEKEMARGRTLAEIRADEVAFGRTINDLQLEMESGLRPEDVVFLDRGYPDCLAFYHLVGQDPNAFLPSCFRHRYASVFVLDRFPVVKDTARVESDEVAALLDRWIPAGYAALGYAVIRVPVLPPGERLGFILDRLSRPGRA